MDEAGKAGAGFVELELRFSALSLLAGSGRSIRIQGFFGVCSR